MVCEIGCFVGKQCASSQACFLGAAVTAPLAEDGASHHRLHAGDGRRRRARAMPP